MVLLKENIFEELGAPVMMRGMCVTGGKMFSLSVRVQALPLGIHLANLKVLRCLHPTLFCCFVLDCDWGYPQQL